MGLFTGERVASLPVAYGKELTQAAQMFGARSRRDARRHPGGFSRPVTGGFSASMYWEGEAHVALREAVKDDPSLQEMYAKAHYLSGKIGSSTAKPYRVRPDVEAAGELAVVTTSIKETLDAKDLDFAIVGKWIDRTVDLGTFALRVIDGTGKLYQGLSPDTPTNTIEFWQPVAGLAPED